MADELHLVTFKVGTELFGVPISAVQEIVRVPAIAHIPQSPEFVKGVMNLRGRVITVVDMHKRMGHADGLSESEFARKARILVVEVEGRLVGVIVDEVAEVLRLAARHDKALGEELLAKLNTEKQQEATEAADKFRSSFNAPEAVSQRLNLARQLLSR